MSCTFSQFGRPFLFYAIYMLSNTDIFLHESFPCVKCGMSPRSTDTPTSTSYQKSSWGCSSLLFPHNPPITLWLHLLFHLQEDKVHMKKVRYFLLPFFFVAHFLFSHFAFVKIQQIHCFELWNRRPIGLNSCDECWFYMKFYNSSHIQMNLTLTDSF